MSKLEQDTQLTGTDGTYRTELHEDWQVWFPNGGYMGAMLLRAVGQTSVFDKPISQTCYFLSVPKIGVVDIFVKSLKQTRNVEALSFSMTQKGKPIMQGLAWTGRAVEGYVHDDAAMPQVASKDTLKSTREIVEGHAPQEFWNNFEQRPITQDLHWHQKEPGSAIQQDWLCFNTKDVDEDPFINAGRFVVLLDSYGWPAAARAHSGDERYIAPTLSLTIDFHREYHNHWMLSEAASPVAENGYMHVKNRLWSEEGAILASAQAMLMCRPRP